MLQKQKNCVTAPWLQNGLTHILLATEARRDELCGLAQPLGKAPQNPTPKNPPAQNPPQNPIAQKPTAAQNPAPQKAVQARASASNSDSNPRINEVENTSRPWQPTILQEQDWPAKWKALRERRPFPARPKVVWTYEGLGADLTGQGMQSRQDLVVKLLKALRHPAGTHYFWPYTLATGQTTGQMTGQEADLDQEAEDASLFWSGEAILRPRALLLFGQEAHNALNMPESLVLFTTLHVRGRRVILLPPVQQLANNQEDYAHALGLTVKALAFCE